MRRVDPKTLKLHPRAEDLVPRMKQDEWSALLDDVRNRGVLEAIELMDGLILDGRHRWRAALEADLPDVPVAEAALIEDETAEEFILRRAVVGRRMFSKAQIAYVAAKDYGIQVKKGKERQLKNLKPFADSPDVELFSTSVEPEERKLRHCEVIGNKYGISDRYVRIAHRLMHADPDAFDLLGAGDLSMKEVTEILAKLRDEDLARKNEQMKEEIETLRSTPRMVKKTFAIHPRLVRALKPYDWADAQMLNTLDPLVQEMIANVIDEKGSPEPMQTASMEKSVDDADLRIVEMEMEAQSKEEIIEDLREQLYQLQQKDGWGGEGDELETQVADKQLEIAEKEKEVAELKERNAELAARFQQFKDKVREKLNRLFNARSLTWHMVDAAVINEKKLLEEKLQEAERKNEELERQVAALLADVRALRDSASVAGHFGMEDDFCTESKIAFRGLQRLLGTLHDDAVLQVPDSIETARISSDVVNLLMKTMDQVQKWLQRCTVATRTATEKMQKKGGGSQCALRTD